MAIVNNDKAFSNHNNDSRTILGESVAITPQQGENIFRKGEWTPEEDAILSDHVGRHGARDWNAIHRSSALRRDGKSCRLRWTNHLRPNLRKGPMSSDEEKHIIELHSRFGNKWATIANHIKGRTDNDIKNYWYARVKKCQRMGIPICSYPEIQETPISNFVLPESPYHPVMPPMNPVENNIGTLFDIQETPISNFVLPESPYHPVMPPMNPVENNIGTLFDIQETPISNFVLPESPYHPVMPPMNPVENNNGTLFDILVSFLNQSASASPLPTQTLPTESPALNHSEDGSYNEEALSAGLTSKDNVVDEEMAFSDDIDIASLLEYPVRPPYSEWTNAFFGN